MRRTCSLLRQFPPSVIHSHKVFGRHLFIKRDDLVEGGIAGLNGNKSRKFLQLMTSSSRMGIYCSFGGIQSNSMLAVSKIASQHRKPFYYFTDSSVNPSQLDGNVKNALKMGMKVNVWQYVLHSLLVQIVSIDRLDFIQLPAVKSSTFPGILSKYVPEVDSRDVFWIPQGGCFLQAQQGVDTLGMELQDFITSSSTSYEKWKVIVSSGTGTTALFLSQFFHAVNPAVEVLAVPCGCSSSSLMSEMRALDSASNRLNVFPTVVPSEPKRAFAKPCLAHWALWQSLRQQTSIEFDLIYAPRCWELLIEHYGVKCDDDQGSSSGLERYQSDSSVLADAWEGCGVIYYHCGGVEGNESQIDRYNRRVNSRPLKK